MKKILGIVLGAVMVMNLTACSGGGAGAPAASTAAQAAQAQSGTAEKDGGQSTDSGYPVDKVTLLCPSDAGGAMDQNCRMMAPYLEKHLGVPVEVTNMGGSACWIGWSYLYNEAPKDGSCISFANFPNMITGYLDTANTTSAFPRSAWSVDVASKTCASTFPAFMRLTFSVIRPTLPRS